MTRGLLLTAAVAAIAGGASAGQAASPSLIVFSADRAPSVSGEIYRLDPNGHRVDLSRSPYQDTQPTVSTDGKRVAFLSNRSGREGVYEVGIDGRGLVRVAPSLHLSGQPWDLAWQPHGRLLAVESSGYSEPGGHVWIVRPRGKPIEVSRRFGFGTLGNADFGILSQQAWSPDGRVLLVSAGGHGMRAVTPQGRTLWTAYADQPIGAWSRQGLLAVPIGHGAAIYGENGHLRFSFRLPSSNATFAWSPDGRHLAVYWSGKNYNLEVRTAKGRFVLWKKNFPGYQIAWAGNSRVVAGNAACSACAPRTIGIDLRTKKVSRVSHTWLDPLSSNRKLAIVTPASGSGFALGVAPTAGGSGRTYARVRGCSGDGVWMPAASSLQFAGPGRSIVYQSWNVCDAPFSNLYSVPPDGRGVQRLTHVQAQETQPAISPDRSKIAYVWASGNNTSCKGCSDGIRIASTDGTELRTLTNPHDCTFDDSPTWSPDGSTILFSESSCAKQGELYTVPVAGGPVHVLGIAGYQPAWGPSRIAYVGSEQSDSGVWTARPDGSNRKRVAKNGDHPAWSSDGRLAYLTGQTVHVGSKAAKLPFAQVNSLSWSPDSTRFIVTARKKNAAAFDVYSVKTNGTDPVRLTKNYNASGASW